jgi:ribosomal protein L37E
MPCPGNFTLGGTRSTHFLRPRDVLWALEKKEFSFRAGKGIFESIEKVYRTKAEDRCYDLFIMCMSRSSESYQLILCMSCGSESYQFILCMSCGSESYQFISCMSCGSESYQFILCMSCGSE